MAIAILAILAILAVLIRLGPLLGHPRIVRLRSRWKVPLRVLRFGMGIIIPLLAVGKGSDPSLWQRELVHLFAGGSETARPNESVIEL